MSGSLAFASLARGSGKSVCALNTAALLAKGGQSVLLVDASPKEDLSNFRGLADTGVVLDRNGRMVMRPTNVEGLTILCRAHRMLCDEAQRFQQVETLRKLEEQFDWLVFDTPSKRDAALDAVLSLARRVVVPVQGNGAAYEHLPETLQAVLDAQFENTQLELLGFLRVETVAPGQATGAARAQESWEFLARAYPQLCLRAAVPALAEVRQSFADGLALVDSAPASAGASAFHAFGTELRQRLPEVSLPEPAAAVPAAPAPGAPAAAAREAEPRP
ncbi:MAG: ParA family protein, partial [Candidatus Sumerlaeia bacterium]|nr:ParA family protein [Candidatus Sumerlaeia bacterium]